VEGLKWKAIYQQKFIFFFAQNSIEISKQFLNFLTFQKKVGGQEFQAFSEIGNRKSESSLFKKSLSFLFCAALVKMRRWRRRGVGEDATCDLTHSRDPDVRSVMLTFLRVEGAESLELLLLLLLLLCTRTSVVVQLR